METRTSGNLVVKQYLDEYCKPDVKRDFAVLLDGPWGAGKTHFIKKYLVDHPNHLYVSLYGTSDVRQIDDEIFRQLHPVLASSGMRLFGRVAKGFLKGALKIDLDGDGKDDGTATVAIPDLELKSHFSDPEGHLLVFDDLERCSLKVSEVLGYINVFVEHAGMKAIILGSEAEIAKRKDDERYFEIKEKLVGQTLRLTASVVDAYSEFLEGVEDQHVRDFLREERCTAIAIHRSSLTNNLRLLKQSLWDYERLAACFQQYHWSNAVAMRALMQQVLALSIEYRAGAFKDPSIIQSLSDGKVLRRMGRAEGAVESPADKIEEKYPTVDFGDNIVGAKILSNAVINGFVDRSEVHESLSQSRYFAAIAERPLWLRAWDYFDLNDHQATEIGREFKSAFDRREFVEDGVLFHAFGICFRYAEIGLLTWSRTEALSQCKRYVDDLAAASKIKFDPERQSHFDFNGSYGGHGFMEREQPDFIEAVSYYEQRYEEAASEAYKNLALDLLSKLELGSDDFLLDLAHNNVRVSKYCDRPILAAIDPQRFVDTVMKLPGKYQRLALNTLNERYRFLDVNSPLADEMPWLVAVRDLLRARVSAAGPVTTARLGYLIDKYVDQSLSRWDAVQAQSAALAQASSPQFGDR